jgi:EmrB/QacA subfamily drug resistance transporter
MAAVSASGAQMKNGGWILAATILGSSLAFIDGTVVNVALPALQTALQATVSDVQWVVESYALLLASLLLVGGSLGDLYGRRKLFLCGVVVFAMASAACGFSPSIDWLIFARAIQGVGAALLIPGSLAVISASFPVEVRGRAIGTWSGFTAIMAAIGPVLGGWLVQHVSWRWVFFVNLPIAALTVALTVWKVPESRGTETSRSLDWLGALLATIGLGAVTFALIEAPRRGAPAAAIGIIGLGALAGFLVVESRYASPMVSLKLFRSRNFSGANLLTLFLYAALSGVLFFFPLNLIQVQRYTPTQAGAALLPFILIVFVLSRWSGGLVARYGGRTPLTIGSVIVAAGYFVLMLPGIGGEYWKTVFPGMVLLGIGMAVCVAPLTTTVMDAVDQRQAGVASGVNNAVSRMAGLLAVAVFGLVMYGVFSRTLDRRLARLQMPSAEIRKVDAQKPKLAAMESSDPRVMAEVGESFLFGYRSILWLAVVLALGSAVTARLWLDPPKEN